MKKLFVILVMTLLGYESIQAQLALATVENNPDVLKDPIMPRKKGNDQYRLTYVRDTFLIGDGPLNAWWRDNTIKIINEAYAAHGKSRRLDRSNIDWIGSNISYSYKDLGPHQNSGLQDKNPVFFPDNDGWSGNCGVFRDDEEGIVVVLFKTQCMNLVKVPQKVLPKAPDLIFRKPDVVDTVRTTAGVTVINNIYNNNSISGSANNTNTNTVSAPASEARYVIGEEEQQQCVQPIRRPVYYNQPPVMMRQRPQIRLSLSVRGGRQQQFYQPVQERGYMGGGRAGTGGGQGQMGGGGGNNNGNQAGGRGN